MFTACRRESDYRELIERHLVSLADNVQSAALKAWQGGDRETAVQVLAEGAMAEPDNAALPLLLAKLLIRDDRAEDAYAVLAEAPDRSETRFTLAALHLMADEYGAALEQLSELQRRDPDYCAGLPRRALLVLLDLLGPEDERAQRYRKILFDH